MKNALAIAQRNSRFLNQSAADRRRQTNKVLILTNQRLNNPKAAMSLHIARYLTTSSAGLKEEFKLRNDEKELFVKGGFKLSFYSGLKMYDLVGLRIDRCQAI